MKSFVDNLHQNGQQYGLTILYILQSFNHFLCYAVHIVDPGIKVLQGYDPYDKGLEMDIFIKVRPATIFIVTLQMSIG